MTLDVVQRPLPVIPARVKRLVIALVAALVAGSIVGSAFAPVLLVKAPLLLVALAPDARHLALVVGSVPAAPLVAVAFLRRLLFSAGSFGIGVIYGPAAVTWVEDRSPRAGRLFRFLERLFARWGPLILLVWPFGSACILAGAARTRFVTFLAAAGTGHAIYVTSIYLIGELISGFAARVLAFLSAHLVESTAVCVGLVAAHQLISRRRAANRRKQQPPAA